MRDTQVMNYVELANGEIIETNLIDEEQRVGEVNKSPVRIDGKKQKNIFKINNLLDIFIILTGIIFIILILLIIIKYRNLSKSQDNKGSKKSKLKISITIALILILLTFIFML